MLSPQIAVQPSAKCDSWRSRLHPAFLPTCHSRTFSFGPSRLLNPGGKLAESTERIIHLMIYSSSARTKRKKVLDGEAAAGARPSHWNPIPQFVDHESGEHINHIFSMTPETSQAICCDIRVLRLSSSSYGASCPACAMCHPWLSTVVSR